MEARVALFPFLTKYGTNSISYPALYSELNHWIDKTYGVALYASQFKYNFVLGRPLCTDNHLPFVLSSLIKDLKSPAFMQIGECAAKILHENFNYKITQIGTERFLDVQSYVLNDSPKKNRLRTSVKKGLEKATVFELNQQQLHDKFKITENDLEAFSAEWFKIKTLKRPLQLLIRKPVYKDELYVRKFYSFDNYNRLLGFVFFTPIFKDNQIIGYCTDIMRASMKAPYGHVAFMILQAMAKFRKEGVQFLSLGLSPQVSLNSSKYKKDLLTHQTLKLLYKNGNSYFNFRGIYNYKKQFGGITKPSFIATNRRFSMLESYALMRYMKFL